MQKKKLLKSMLVPMLWATTIGSIAAIATSCGCGPTLKEDCVTIYALSDSTFELENIGYNEPNLRYSFDGKNWNTYHTKLPFAANKKLYLKGNNPDGWSKSVSKFSSLCFTGNVSITGNIMGLLDNGAKDGEKGDITDIPCDYCFVSLFSDSKDAIRNIGENFLPSLDLKEYCYSRMFYGCSSLTQAPNLPAVSLANDCYIGMFCGCSSLTQAPALPAKTLANDCYYQMFKGCSSLEIAPELPATNLADNCYNDMFYGCTSLVVAPDLPAATLSSGCYSGMFKGCNSLNSIKIVYDGFYSDICFGDWVTDIADIGTFYYKGQDTVENFGFSSDWIINSNW